MQLFEVITIIAVVALITALGLFVFLFFAAFSSRIKHSSKSQELEEEYSNQYIARNAELVRILQEIGRPDLPSGDYSEGKKVLWAHYKKKLDEHESLAKQEREHVVNTYFGG
jgi:hypothetical protein